MAGANGEDTFMKNSADTDVARLRNNNFWAGEILIWTPCHDPVYFQHPNSCGFELSSPAHIFLLSSPIIHETFWAKLSRSREALMKSTSLSERVWKNNGGTEIITLHSALGFNTFLIKVSLAGWITTVILDALLIKASHAGTEKSLHFIIIFAWDMARGKKCWKSRLTSCHLLVWSKKIWRKLVCWLNCSRYLKKKKNQLASCSAHLIHNKKGLKSIFSTGHSPKMLRGYTLNQQGFGDCKGGRVQFLSKPI